MSSLEKEVGDEATVSSPSLSSLDVNEEINSVIYRQITKRGESAFVNFLVYPTLLLAIGVIFSLVVRMLSLS